MKQSPFLAFALCALTSLPAAAFAQASDLPRGDITAFEACFIQLMLDNPDNPMVGMTGPILCGERNIPMGQSCDTLDYLLFDRRKVCKTDDLAFWQRQVDTRAAASVADGREGVGGLHESGLAHCAEVEAAGSDPTDCLIEIHWRTSMEFIAAGLVASLSEASQ